MLVICVCAALAGCSNTNKATDDTASNQPKPAMKSANLRFVTGVARGSWAQIGAGIADKTNAYFEGFPITAIPGGSESNPLMLYHDKAQLGMSYGPFLLLAGEGQKPYDMKVKNVRAVAMLMPTVMHFLADKNLPADTLGEMIEKKIPVRFGIPPQGSGSNYLTQLIFSQFGFSDIDNMQEYGSKVFYAGGSSLHDAWMEKYINMAVMTYNVPAAPIGECLSAREGKLLSIDDKILDTLVREKGFSRYTIPAGTYPGQSKDIQTAALKIVIIAREDLPEDIVYNMTKTIYNNRTHLIGVHSSFKQFSPDEMVNDIPIVLHKGAERFYREVRLIK